MSSPINELVPSSNPTAFGRLVIPAYRVALLLMLGLGMLLSALGETLAQDAQPRVDVVDLDANIPPVMARYVGRAIDRTEENGAEAVVLRMDTPGGLSTAMDDIITGIPRSAVQVVD